MNEKEFLTMDALPDQSGFTGQELDLQVPHKLTIVDAKRSVTTNGHLALECSYAVDDTKLEIRYDYCTVKMAKGEDCPYGQAKLKKILKATNTAPQGQFTVATVAELIKGKSFMDKLEKNNKGYYVLVSNLDDIKPCDEIPSEDTSILEEEPIFDNNKTTLW